MSPWVKKIQKELGIDDRRAKKVWDSAIGITEDMFGKKQTSFSAKEFEYAYDTAIEMIKKEEIKYSIAEFVTSGKSAKEYLETVMSSSFSPTLDQHLVKDDEEPIVVDSTIEEEIKHDVATELTEDEKLALQNRIRMYINNKEQDDRLNPEFDQILEKATDEKNFKAYN